MGSSMFLGKKNYAEKNYAKKKYARKKKNNEMKNLREKKITQTEKNLKNTVNWKTKLKNYRTNLDAEKLGTI